LLLKISVAELDSLLFATEDCIISVGLPVVTDADALISLNSKITPIDARDGAIKVDAANNDWILFNLSPVFLFLHI
jgi:hypothetical protein